MASFTRSILPTLTTPASMHEGILGFNNLESICPPYKEIESLVIDPSNPNILYMSTHSGVYKSKDGGRYWNQLDWTENLPASDLVINPLEPTTIYALMDAGVCKSTDGGYYWENTHLPFCCGMWFLEIDPTMPNVIYSGGWEGVTKSNDGGGNWEIINGSLNINENIWVADLAIASTSTTTLFAGMNRGGIYMSTNGGGNWAGIGSQDYHVHKLEVDPTTQNTISAVLDSGEIMEISKTNSDWMSIVIGIQGVNVNVIVVDKRNPTDIFAGTDEGVFMSNDKGANWHALDSRLGIYRITALAIKASAPPIIYAGTDCDNVFILQKTR